jgi:ATP-binding cassette subfamily C protein
MLAVYDQALPSGSVAALAILTGLATILHALFAVFDAIRARIVCRAGLGFVEFLDGEMLAAAEGHGRCRAPLDDVECVRRFLTGGGPCAAFDVLWLPAFLTAIFLLHPALGVFACVGSLLLALLAVSAEARSRTAGLAFQAARRRRYILSRDLRRVDRLTDARVRRRWRTLSRSYSEVTFAVADRALAAMALGKGLRLVLQSAGLGLSAFLVIGGSLSPGALFASPLLLARTFACLDGALLHWSGFVAARESYRSRQWTDS